MLSKSATAIVYFHVLKASDNRFLSFYIHQNSVGHLGRRLIPG